MIDETTLTKGLIRKLDALRKSIGPVIAEEVFSSWLDQTVEVPESDSNAEVIQDELWGLVLGRSALHPTWRIYHSARARAHIL